MGSGGGARAVLEEGLKEGISGLLNGTDSPAASLRSKPRCHDGLNRANGVKLRRRRSYPRWRPGSNLAASGAVVDDGGLGRTPDVEAERVRGSWRLETQRKGRLVVAQSSYAGEAERRPRLGLWVDGGAGGAAGGLKRTPGDLGVRLGKEGRGDFGRRFR